MSRPRAYPPHFRGYNKTMEKSNTWENRFQPLSEEDLRSLEEFFEDPGDMRAMRHNGVTTLESGTSPVRKPGVSPVFNSAQISEPPQLPAIIDSDPLPSGWARGTMITSYGESFMYYYNTAGASQWLRPTQACTQPWPVDEHGRPAPPPPPPDSDPPTGATEFLVNPAPVSGAPVSGLPAFVPESVMDKIQRVKERKSPARSSERHTARTIRPPLSKTSSSHSVARIHKAAPRSIKYTISSDNTVDETIRRKALFVALDLRTNCRTVSAVIHTSGNGK